MYAGMFKVTVFIFRFFARLGIGYEKGIPRVYSVAACSYAWTILAVFADTFYWQVSRMLPFKPKDPEFHTVALR
jgi:hypothetical protein